MWGKPWGKISFSWPPGRLGRVLGCEVMLCAVVAGFRAIGLTMIPCPWMSSSRRLPGPHPISSPEELSSEAFGTDAELEEFLAFIAASRRADLT